MTPGDQAAGQRGLVTDDPEKEKGPPEGPFPESGTTN